KPKAGEMPTVEESPVKDNKIEGVNEQVVSTKKKKKAKGSKSEDVERIDESSNAKYEKSVEAEASSVAEEVKQEVLAQSTEVKQEVSIEKLSQALQNKIDSVIEKISNSKVETSASNELAEKLALEQKAKEDAVRHFKALEEKFEALMAKVSKLESTDKTVETKVAQIVASTGIDAVAVSVDTQMSQENASDEDVFKKFESLSGAEQRKYYVENKDIIARHASALLRQNKRS
ncbi:MAG: hypothetical protein EB163_09665, partial [Nitrososphaeria archaeon]|nr:hypothetical protein [Nitrososphaeria archaeon]